MGVSDMFSKRRFQTESTCTKAALESVFNVSSLKRKSEKSEIFQFFMKNTIEFMVNISHTLSCEVTDHASATYGHLLHCSVALLFVGDLTTTGAAAEDVDGGVIT